MAQAERALREPTFSEMEAGRHLIHNGRAWLTLTDQDVERGARAVVLDPHYRSEIGRSALKHAMEVGDPVLMPPSATNGRTSTSGPEREVAE